MVSARLLECASDLIKKRLFCYVKNSKQSITYAWLLALLLVLITFIISCIAASKLSNGGSNRAAGFAAVWTCLLLIFISIVGSCIMRKYQNALSIGIFLGIIFIMSNQMLIVFVFFADYAENSGADAVAQSAVRAMAAFSFFLFLIYTIFGMMLCAFRRDIIKDSAPSNEEDEKEEVNEEGDEVYEQEDN